MSNQIKLMPYRGFPFFFQRIEDKIDLANDTEISVGDSLYVDKWNGAIGKTIRIQYPVEEVIESRPARGDWGPLGFIPTWFRLRVGEAVVIG